MDETMRNYSRERLKNEHTGAKGITTADRKRVHEGVGTRWSLSKVSHEWAYTRGQVPLQGGHVRNGFEAGVRGNEDAADDSGGMPVTAVLGRPGCTLI